VACNSALRERFEKSAPSGLRVIIAPKKFCTDNAAMVAGLAFHKVATAPPLNAAMTLDVDPNLGIGD